ncbi:MAG: EamA family transporter [Acidobacteriota bacterium]
MTIRILLATLLAVALSAIAQLVLKYGMSGEAVQNSLGSSSWTDVLRAVVLNWKIVLGMAIYAVSMGVWLLVLARVDVSQAYPFVGLGFVITAACGHFLLGESFGLQRIGGTILVGIGVYLIAKG